MSDCVEDCFVEVSFVQGQLLAIFFFSNHLGSLSSKDLYHKKHNTSQKRKTKEPMNKKLSPEFCSVSKVMDTIFRIPCSP